MPWNVALGDVSGVLRSAGASTQTNVSWPRFASSDDPRCLPAADYVRLIYGILGSVIVGWMVVLGAIALGSFRRREQWAWWALFSSVAVWFVLDTTMSLALRWPTHAAFNVPFGAALATPIVALRPRYDFRVPDVTTNGPVLPLR